MKDYSEQTLANPSWIKRYSHEARFRQALKLLALADGKRVLDYGAGDGSLSKMLLQQIPAAKLSLFEPTDELREQAMLNLAEAVSQVEVLSDTSQATAGAYDYIVCLEVLEHLPQEIRSQALDNFASLIAADGQLIISVPIETGLTALLKNIIRVSVGQAHESTSLVNVLRAAFGDNTKIPRVSRQGYIDSHLGFNYHDLEADLRARDWIIERRRFTPLPWLRSLLNSQIFYTLRRP